MKLAKRVTELPELQTILMAKKSRQLRAQGLDVINLSLGEPDFFTPDAVKAAGIDAIHQNFSFYPPVAGFLDLQKAIAEKLITENGIDTCADEIVVSTGAKQAIANIVLSLIEPGDEVIIPAPFWVSYPNIVQLAGGKSVILSTSIDNQYKLTRAQLEKSITPRTKLLILCTPNNPTGSVYRRDELAALAEVIKNTPDLWVISDEIYEYLYYGEEKPVSIASLPGMKDRVITINGFSKGHAMTGWRLGYSCSPKKLAEAAEKMQAQITSGASSITQRAALAALTLDKTEIEKMRLRFKARRDVLLEGLSSIPNLGITPPEGAFYVFPDVSFYLGKTINGRCITDANALCLYLLEEALVATVPGDAFGEPSAIRLSFATSEEKLSVACQRLKEAFGAIGSGYCAKRTL